MGKLSFKLPWKRKKREVGPDGRPVLGSLEYKIQACEAYLALWQRLFKFLATSLADRKILPEHEKEFGRVVYQCAFEHFKFTKLMGGGFSGAKKIIQILDKCPSLGQLKEMPEASFAALQVEWHEVFLAINKTLGHLIAQRPPAEPTEEQKGVTALPPGVKPAAAAGAKPVAAAGVKPAAAPGARPSALPSSGAAPGVRPSAASAPAAAPKTS